ncbi:hypothetical protein AB0H83_44890 [Dactylosporangium sp. NPDC050688]|uniref:RICIN domain-containing protein n=1 Tax=Dactylosporangium sp. NPDC050688 TaxID=3157217 RepID=UPI0033E894BC
MLKRPGLFRRTLLLIVGVLVASLAFQATPAQAYPPNAGIIRNWETGRCLDSDWNGNVYTLPCNGGNFQNWYINVIIDRCGYGSCHVGSLLINAETGRCIVSWGAPAYVQTTSDWSDCWIRNQSQNWDTPTSNNYVVTRFKWYPDPNFCLDSNYAGDVYTMSCNGGGFQNWRADGNL